MKFEVDGAFNKLKKTREMFWSGRPDLNRRPPAPKAGALPGCATPRQIAANDSTAFFDFLFGEHDERLNQLLNALLEWKFPPECRKFPALLADLCCRTALPHLRFARYGPGR